MGDLFDPEKVASSIWDNTYKSSPKKDDDIDVSDLLERMRGGVFKQESGGNYQVKPNARTGATGGFQVLPTNIPQWTKTHLGRSLTREQFERDPQAQEAVFSGEMGKYLKKARKIAKNDDEALRMAAAGWYGGEGAMHRYDDPKRFRPNEPSFREYTLGVLNKSGKPFDPDAVASNIWGSTASSTEDPDEIARGIWGRPNDPTDVGIPRTPTNPKNVAPVKPFPETQKTIEAQLQSLADPSSPKSSVLVNDPAQIQTLGGDYIVEETPEGIVVSNPNKPHKGLAADLGKVQDVGRNTQGTAVLTTDAEGNELNASIVKDPKAAAEQVKLDKKMYPQAANHELVDSKDVVARRAAGLEQEGFAEWAQFKNVPQTPETLAQFQQELSTAGQGSVEVDAAVNAPTQPTGWESRQIQQRGQQQANFQPQGEVSAVAEWTGQNAKEGALASAASKLGGQIGVDQDLVKAYLDKGNFEEGQFTQERAERGKKGRESITFALDANAVSELKAMQAEKTRRKQAFEEALAKQANRNPKINQLQALIDSGLKTAEEIQPLINEELAAEKNLTAVERNDAEALNRVFQTNAKEIAEGADPRALAEDFYTQKQDAKFQRLSEDVFGNFGGFAEKQKNQAEIEEKYKNRPLARPTEFALNIGREFLKLPGTASKLLAIGTDAMSPVDIPPEKNPFLQFGREVDKRVDSSRNKDFKDELIVNDVAQGFSQLIQQGILTPLTGGASLVLPVTQAATSQYDEAAKGGATKNQRLMHAGVGALASVPDALLKFRFLKNLSPAGRADFLDKVITDTAQGLAKSMTKNEARQATLATFNRFLLNSPVGYFGEKYQEKTEDIINKALAKQTYKPQMTWNEVIAASDREAQGHEAAGLVGIFGAGVNTVTEHIQNLSTPELRKTDALVDRAISEGLAPEKAQEVKAIASAELAKRNTVTDKQGRKYTILEDKGENVLVRTESGSEILRKKDKLIFPEKEQILEQENPETEKVETPLVEESVVSAETPEGDVWAEVDEVLKPSGMVVEPPKNGPKNRITPTRETPAKGMEIEAPIRPETVEGAKGRIKELETEVQTERRKADTNPLTGLGSKNVWQKALPNIEADPNQEIISLDVNRMKDANDTTSHTEVDEKVLKKLGEATKTVLERHGIDTRNAFTPGGDEAYVAVPLNQGQQIRDEIETEFGTVELIAKKDYTNDRTGESFKKGDVVPVTLSGSFGPTVEIAEGNLDVRKKASKEANPVRRSTMADTFKMAAEPPTLKPSDFQSAEDYASAVHKERNSYKDAHSAPVRDTRPVDEKLEDGGDYSLTEVAKGQHNQPDDYFDPRVGARYYSYDDAEGQQSFRAIRKIIDAKGKGEITIYRSVPNEFEGQGFRDGDWVTFSKRYAENHGEHRFGEGEYKIISQAVSPNDVWWDGNDINEWGYDTGKEWEASEQEWNDSESSLKQVADNQESSLDSLYDENGDINNEQVQNTANEVIQGTSRIKRLSRKGEQGRIDGGELLVGSSLIVGGETGTNKENAKNESVVLKQVADTAPSFYSQVERTIEQKMPKKASAEQIKGILKDAKKEEVEWLDLDTFLADNPNPTKQELLDYVRENNVQIEEVEKGERAGKTFEEVETEIQETLERGDRYEFPRGGYIDRSGAGGYYRVQPPSGKGIQFAGLEMALEVAVDHDLIDIVDDKIAQGSDTKFSQYTLPGGENYRELLLTMPRDGESDLKAVQKEFDEASRRGESPHNNEDLMRRLRAANERTIDPSYKSSHWSEPNVLAHVRYDSRDNGKTLHVAEIQSDWHQEGRKKGYSSDAIKIEPTGSGRFKILRTASGRPLVAETFATEQEARQYAKTNLTDTLTNTVPDAPFKTSWPLMAFKRVLRHAVENGYERITWDTGETNAARYDLSKQVDALRIRNMGSGKQVNIGLADGNSVIIQTDAGGSITSSTQSELKGKPLADAIGKELAEKVMESEDGAVLRDSDLKVGGEGMKAFYDKILPAEVNKYVKKWGGKVELDKVVTEKGNSKGDWAFRDGRIEETQFGDFELYGTRRGSGEEVLLETHDTLAEAQHELKLMQGDDASIQAFSLTITPAMRESVSQGQPLFKVAEEGDKDYLTSLPKAHSQDLMERAQSKFTDGNLELNEEAGELLRRLMVNKGDSGSSFYGVVQDSKSLKALAKEADSFVEQYLEVGYTDAQVKGLKTLADNLRELSNQAHGIAYVFDESLPEESHHKLVLDLLNGKRFDKSFYAPLKEMDVWNDPLIKRQYPKANDFVRAVEIAAKLETGQIKSKDKDKFLNHFADGIIDTVGPIDNPAFYDRVLNYASTQTSDTRGRTESEGEPSPSGSDSQESRGEGDRDSQARGNGDRTSQTPRSLRGKAGIPIEDRTYTSVTNAEQQDFANQQLDKGVDQADKWFTENADDNNLNRGTTAVVGLNLMNHYAKTGQIDKMNRVADKVVPMVTEAAQTVQAMAIVSSFDPERAAAYAAKIKKQKQGKDLTHDEAKRATRVATELSETAKVEGISEVALEQAQALIKDLESDIQSSKDALIALSNENQTLKLDLEKAKEAVKDTKKSPKARVLKDIRKREAEIRAAIAEKYGVTVKQVADGSLRITAVSDGLRKWLKGQTLVGEMDSDAKREWLQTFGRDSNDTGRKIRYEYELSDGRIVSADSALKATNPEAYARLKQKHTSFRSDAARDDLFKSLPTEVQKQIYDDLPIDQATINGKYQTLNLAKILTDEGHILGGKVSMYPHHNQEILARVFAVRKSNEPSILKQAAEDNDLQDWAILTLADNWSKMNVGEFYNQLNQITNGQLSEQEVKEIHANAVEAITSSRTVSDDQKAAFKTRAGHLRAAKKFRNEQLAEMFPKTNGEKVNKAIAAIINEGVANFTDNEIVFALIRKKHTNVNDAIKEYEKVQGEKVTKQEMVRANELLNNAKQNLKDNLLQAKNDFALTKEDIAAIREEQRINRAMGSKAQREAQRFYDGLSRTTGQVLADTVVNLRRSNMLTGLKTHLQNIVSNAAFGATEEASRGLGWLADVAVSGITGERTTDFINPRGIAKSFEALVRADDTLKNLNKESGLKRAKDYLKHGGTFEEREKLQHLENVAGEKFGTIGKGLDTYINGVFKVLGAEDALFKAYAFRRALETEARTKAISERREDRSVNVKERTRELLLNPSNEMIVTADKYADFATFQNDNKISDFIRSIKAKHQAVKTASEVIMPYDRTPTNIFLRIVEHSPVGFVSAGRKLLNLKQGSDKAFRNQYRAAIENDLRTKDDFLALPPTKQRELVDKGIEKAFSRQQQKEFARTFGRAGTGSSVFVLGYFLAAAGLLTGSMSPDDDDKKETNEFFERRKTGIENRSILIPGVGRFVLPTDPVSKVLIAGATFYEQSVGEKGNEVQKAWNGVVESTEDAVFEQPLMSSTTNVVSTFKKKKFGEFAGNLIGTTLVPRLVSDVGEVIDEKPRTGSGYDPEKKGKGIDYQVRGFRNSLLNKIPFARVYADENTGTVSPQERGGPLRRMVRAVDIFNTRSAKEYTAPVMTPIPKSPLNQEEYDEGVKDMIENSPEFKRMTTNDLVSMIKEDTAAGMKADRLKRALSKKVKNAQRSGTFTAEEAQRSNEVLGTNYKASVKKRAGKDRKEMQANSTDNASQ